MEFVILWLIVAAFCGAIASSKNRSFLGWFILGFFFSLLALIAVAVMPALPGKIVAARPMRTESPKLCPDCNTQNSRAFRYCSNCGAPL